MLCSELEGDTVLGDSMFSGEGDLGVATASTPTGLGWRFAIGGEVSRRIS